MRGQFLLLFDAALVLHIASRGGTGCAFQVIIAIFRAVVVIVMSPRATQDRFIELRRVFVTGGGHNCLLSVSNSPSDSRIS
ncbi:hypothetical protein BJX96DRAFT_128381 [Aspergillus floccosus]